MSLTEAQIEQRRSYITGTDAGVIMGVNKYQSLFDVWQFKMGFADGPDLSNNPRVKAGHYLEQVVADMFSDATGVQLAMPETDNDTLGLRIHKEHKWMAGNVDRLVLGEDAIFEAKTAGTDEGWGPQGTNLIPKPYACQVAHYMAVENVDYAYVAVLIAGYDFRWYKLDRSERFEQLLIEKEKAFWQDCVLGMTEPAPRNYDDVVTMYRNKTIESPITATNDIERLIKELKHVKMSQSSLKNTEKRIKDELALFIKDHQTLLSSDGEILATWKQAKESETLDIKELQQAHPDICKQFYKKKTGSRRFLLKGNDDE